MLLVHHFLSVAQEHTFQEHTNCKKKMIWGTIKNKPQINPGPQIHILQ